jgi:hypothetical protein
MRNILLIFTLGAGALCAQDAFFTETRLTAPQAQIVDRKLLPAQKLWRVSVAALAAVNAMDVESSWHKHELNSTLAGANGTFGAQGALIKLGMQGGLVGVEYLLTRRHPSGRIYRAVSLINFGVATGIGSVAGHNYTVPVQR